MRVRIFSSLFKTAPHYQNSLVLPRAKLARTHFLSKLPSIPAIPPFWDTEPSLPSLNDDLVDIKTSVKHKLTLLPEVALGLIPEGLAGRVLRALALPRLLTVALLRAESPETATRSTGDPLATWVLVRSRRHQSRLFQRREVRLRCPAAQLVSRMFPDRSSWASCGGSPAPCYCESGVWESRLDKEPTRSA